LSFITGTVLPPENSITVLSESSTGNVSKSSPLWRSAIRARQEKRL
jgi:hypothetical protein